MTLISLIRICIHVFFLSISTTRADEFRGPSGGSSLNHPIFHSRRQLPQDTVLDHSNGPSKELRNRLLKNYDRTTFPWDFAWNTSLAKNDVSKGGSGLREGLPIEMDLNFHKIFEVNTARSTVDVLVWLRMQWRDPRLTWDPADYNNMTQTWFWIGDGSGSGGETSDIWTPDIQLWNFASSLSDTMMDAHAKVTSDGLVYWTRPGHLIPACKFEGLENFPFDTLKCSMEFGSWVHSGLYIRPVMRGPGFHIGGSDTAGQSFAQFSLEKVEVEEKIYPPFPIAPDEDWPVILYHVSFKRSWEPIARGFLIVQILLNLTGFASLWLPVHSGERMGLCITSVLAAIASDLAVSSQLPLSPETTWFAKFSAGSLIFGIAIVFQCVVVMYFYYCRKNDLQPTWFKWICKKGRKILIRVYYNTGYYLQLIWYKWMCLKRSSQRGINETAKGEDNKTSNQKYDNDLSDNDTVDNKNDTVDDKNEGGEINRDEEEADKEELLNVVSHTQPNTTKSAKEENDMEFFKMLETKELKNNLKWQMLASYIDEASRLVFPAAYVLFLSMMFAST